MEDNSGNVNSNYGWQWQRYGQLDKVIGQLDFNNETRQAAISIYDGKEINKYAMDYYKANYELMVKEFALSQLQSPKL